MQSETRTGFSHVSTCKWLLVSYSYAVVTYEIKLFHNYFTINQSINDFNGIAAYMLD